MAAVVVKLFVELIKHLPKLAEVGSENKPFALLALPPQYISLTINTLRHLVMFIFRDESFRSQGQKRLFLHENGRTRNK